MLIQCPAVQQRGGWRVVGTFEGILVEGIELGETDGAPEKAILGPEDAVFVGKGVASGKVGLGVGVGASVGLGVGARVGPGVGGGVGVGANNVGDLVGAWVGAAVVGASTGMKVGLDDARTVGNWVEVEKLDGVLEGA